MDPAEGLPQAHHDAKAARELSRAAGVALLEMTSVLEEGLEVGDSAGAVTVALIAFAARARRLLRSAYRLIDAGERDTAVPLFRVMGEYLIVGRWLLKVGDEHLKTWAMDELRARRTMLLDLPKHLDSSDTETLELVGEMTARLEDAMRGYAGDDVELSRRAAQKAGQQPPSIEAMAAAAGLGFVYWSYRFQSQADVHANPLATDGILEQGEHGIRVLQIPHFTFAELDSYRFGAHLFLDLVRPLARRVPELGWEPTTEAVGEILGALQAFPDEPQAPVTPAAADLPTGTAPATVDTP